jgi:hypothetical protein
MNAPRLLCLLAAFSLCGCGDDARRPGRPTPDAGPMTDTGGPPPPPFDAGPGVDAGPMGDDCSERARWIYVVDSDGTLIRFEADTLTFVNIGTLNCPAGFGETPFSMSVDRNAMAWILYSDGSLYRASTADATCTATGYVAGQAGMDVFGMGYVADTAGSTEETLYVTGGTQDFLGLGSARLGRIDTTTLTLTAISPDLPGWPELTGTGAGELYAFYPDTSPASVHQLDKNNGASLRNFPLSASGRRIVGAGVSTCAPIVLI